MPLSEEELRLLEQMERALVQEDPKLASTLQGTTLRRAQQRHAILAGVAFGGGIALLMTGVISNLWAVGLLGFVVMLLSATVGLNAVRGRPSPGISHSAERFSSSLRGMLGRRSRHDW